MTVLEKNGEPTVTIEVLHFEGCPNHLLAIERIHEVLEEEGISAEVRETNVDDVFMAQTLGFQRSPSVRVNGLDVEPAARSASDYGMMCRTYAVDGRREGLPSREMVRRAILEAHSSTCRSEQTE